MAQNLQGVVVIISPSLKLIAVTVQKLCVIKVGNAWSGPFFKSAYFRDFCYLIITTSLHFLTVQILKFAVFEWAQFQKIIVCTLYEHEVYV